MGKLTLKEAEEIIGNLENENAALKAEKEAVLKTLEENNPEVVKSVLESEKVKSLQTDIEALKATPALDDSAKEKIAKLEADNKALKAENAKVSKDLAKINNEVPGSFEMEDGRVVKFKKGFVKVNLKGKITDSVDALKDADMMNHLVEIGFGGIEIIEPSK